MSLEELLNEFEYLINESQHIPLSRMVVLDEQQLFELIDRMREVVAEQRFASQAQSDVTAQMREQGLLSAADLERARILEEAQADAEYIRNGADAYAKEILEELEGRLERMTVSIKSGLRELERIQRKHPHTPDIG